MGSMVGQVDVARSILRRCVGLILRLSRRSGAGARIAPLLLLGTAIAVHAANASDALPRRGAELSNLTLEAVSADGERISYQTVNQDQPDRSTSHVLNLKSGRRIDTKLGSGGQFSSEGRWYAFKVASGGVGLVDTATGGVSYEPCARSFDFSQFAENLVLLNRRSPARPECRDQLVTTDLVGSRRKVVENVSEYALSKLSNTIAFIVRTPNSSALFSARMGLDDSNIELAKSGRELSSVVWSEDGSSLAFLEAASNDERSAEGYVVNLYRGMSSAPVLSRLEARGYAGFPAGMHVGPQALRMSRDGLSVFIKLSSDRRSAGDEVISESELKSAPPRVWHYKDARVVSDWTRYASQSEALGVWSSEARKFTALVPVGWRAIAFTRDGKKVITVPDSSQEKGDVFDIYRDVYATDLDSGESDLVVGKLDSDLLGHVAASPDGRYVGYFKDDQWWAYDVMNGNHINLTGRLGSAVHDVESDRRERSRPYGSPGWTSDGARMLVYDRFDIWLVSPRGESPIKITDGARDERVYRIVSSSGMPLLPGAVSDRGDRRESRGFDLSARLLLSSYGERTKKSGFAIYTGKGVEDVVFGDFYVSTMLSDSGMSKFVYQRESFNVPPEIVIVNGDGGGSKVVFGSNREFRRKDWGEGKLIDYVDKRGNRLQGSLFYPARYKKGEKYPLLVSVYETQSQDLHKFVVRSESDYLPITDFTNDGYFVLLPDVAYSEIGPGLSAADSVTSAVEAVIEMGVVRSDSVGITGASFGGYETAFIVSQTSMFAAAVAGSAPTDLVSHYLGIQLGTGQPGMWRFERDQYRLRKPLIDDFERYLKNSPVHNAENIRTPLLTWLGGKDQSVGQVQGFGLYNMMRRSGKRHVLLYYPEEGHVFRSRESMIDLNFRMKEWFDHFLKGAPPADWIVHGEGEQFQLH